MIATDSTVLFQGDSITDAISILIGVHDTWHEFGACFVPFQPAFDRRLAKAPAESWAADGVHPTPAGHALMAECWVNSVDR